MPVIWVQARQHAWEVGSSWTAHGLIEWAIGDSPEATHLRSVATLLVVPIMDVDQAQLGNGGKEQTPHDHNQNWTGTHPKGIEYASVRAAKQTLSLLIADRRLRFFLDVHDPSWAGKFEWWIDSLDGLSDDMRRRALLLKDLITKQSKPIIPLAGFTFTTGKGRNARVWVDQESKRSVVTACFEVPVRAPPEFSRPPPAQHVDLGAAIGISLDKWLVAW